MPNTDAPQASDAVNTRPHEVPDVGGTAATVAAATGAGAGADAAGGAVAGNHSRHGSGGSKAAAFPQEQLAAAAAVRAARAALRATAVTETIVDRMPALMELAKAANVTLRPALVATGATVRSLFQLAWITML